MAPVCREVKISPPGRLTVIAPSLLQTSPPRRPSARHADLQALDVIQAVDFLVEPAAHLHGGIARRQRFHAVGCIGFVPQRLTAALAQPGVHFQGGEAERHAAEELRSRHLALPVVRGAVAHLGGAAGDGIEYLQRRHQLASGVDLDGQASGAHGVDALGQALGSSAQAGEVLRPGSDHLPVHGFCRLGGGLLAGGLVFFAAKQADGGDQRQSGAEQIAAIHRFSPDTVC